MNFLTPPTSPVNYSDLYLLNSITEKNTHCICNLECSPTHGKTSLHTRAFSPPYALKNFPNIPAIATIFPATMQRLAAPPALVCNWKTRKCNRCLPDWLHLQSDFRSSQVSLGMRRGWRAGGVRGQYTTKTATMAACDEAENKHFSYTTQGTHVIFISIPGEYSLWYDLKRLSA